jgi:hypothetical protein
MGINLSKWRCDEISNPINAYDPSGSQLREIGEEGGYPVVPSKGREGIEI